LKNSPRKIQPLEPKSLSMRPQGKKYADYISREYAV